VFDIGFSELVVCAIVALLVIGPERMPEAVRTVGLWIGRLKRGLRETRSEIEKQMGMDDIRRQLHNEEIMRSLEDARRDIDSAVADTQASLTSVTETLEREYQSEPDLPYHSHTEENAALDIIADEATENHAVLPDLLASQIENLDSQNETLDAKNKQQEPNAEQKIQLNKIKPATIAAKNHTPVSEATTDSKVTLDSKTTLDSNATLDSKATL
jgi:sec-independent protein translocase protein TatB